MITVTALITPMQGQTPDDVLAAALGTQHERALINRAWWTPAGRQVQVNLRFDEGAGQAEYEDCIERLEGTPSMGVDSIRAL